MAANVVGPEHRPGPTRRRWPSRVEFTVAVLLTRFVTVLHIRHFTRAGPLWRDEISSVVIATSPTLRELYYRKVNDWTPLLWDGVVRAWTWAGPGRSEPGLRALALIIGLATIAALWANSRLFGAPAPLASLVLLGLNGLALCYGSSLRAYGLGMLTTVLAAGAMFRFARAPGSRQGWSAFGWRFWLFWPPFTATILNRPACWPFVRAGWQYALHTDGGRVRRRSSELGR